MYKGRTLLCKVTGRFKELMKASLPRGRSLPYEQKNWSFWECRRPTMHPQHRDAIQRRYIKDPMFCRHCSKEGEE